MVDQATSKAIIARLPAKMDHGDVLEVDEELFLNAFTLIEKDMFDFIVHAIFSSKANKYTEKDIEAYDDSYYLYIKGDIPIMLCSHVDTVMLESSRLFLTEKTRMLTGDVDSYLGGDDRAGVLGMLWIVSSGLKPHLLFTKAEEHGLVGASKAADAIKPPDIKYIMALDRCGDNECAYYNNGNEDFKKYIKTFGLKEVRGSGNDIKELCPEWKVSGVNVSIGYHNPHTVKDYVSIPEFRICIDRIEKMLMNPPAEKFPFVKAKEEITYYHENYMYNYGYGTCNYRGMKHGRGTVWGDEEEESEDIERYGCSNLEEEEFFGQPRRGKKMVSENIYPKLPFLYDAPREQVQRIFTSMTFVTRSMPGVFFDFKKMTWHYADCDQEEHIDLASFDYFGIIDQMVEKKDQKLVRRAINYLDKHSYIWSRESCYFD